MELTDSQKLENLNCLRAYFDGCREFEYQCISGRWYSTAEPNFPSAQPYRRKPKPALVPWDCFSDVPSDARWLRSSGEPAPNEWDALIVGVFSQGISVGRRNDNQVYSWRDLETYGAKYSTDRKTWLPCTKLKAV